MVASLLNELAHEKIVLVKGSGKDRLPFPMEGVVKFIDGKGHMVGIMLDKNVWEDFAEYLEYTNPKFWEEVEASRGSGRVTSKEIERRLGLK